MTFPEIALLFENIAKVSSRLEKERLLKENESAILKEVLQYALNPYITFGISSFTAMTRPIGMGDSWCEIKIILKKLQKREITGNKARYSFNHFILNDKEAVLLTNILNKDLRCGISVKTVNKVFPKLIPEFNCQLADKDREITYPCIIEPKYDGVRTLAFVENNSITYYARNGKVFENFSEFDNDLLKMGDGVYDGEVIGADFNTLMTEVHRKHNVKKIKKTFMIFDFLKLEEFRNQKCGYTQEERKHQLENKTDYLVLTNIHIEYGILSNNAQQLEHRYKDHLQLKFEGSVVKNPEGLYEFKRSKNWIKLKPTDSLDLEVIGVEEGTGKYKGMLGALVVNHKDVKVSVGSGFSDQQRKDFWNCIDEFSTPIGKIAEITFQEVTPDGSLRFPIFQQFRPDKD